MTQTNPTRQNDIVGELVDVRRLLDALNKIAEDLIGQELEVHEPLFGLISVIRDKIDAAITMIETM
jgi:hypothetical protein